ncbi:MmpS family transport accessory protein [Pedobacter namyangjuensis]|uniref:MmpS family transport accessory protein n=1 Tax=Pedobacter namyangjuensis TaxID=600626 RepID=UPI000DE4A623|nr:MmpS family transport accessory protein [Pedobacter namyangjuensis]
MKKIAKFLSVSLAVLAVTVLFSCKKDDDKKSSYEVEYKVSISSGSLSTIVYTNNQGDQSTLTSIEGTSWSSGKITVPSNVQVVGFGANATSAADPNAKMTLQIIVDGEVKKENTSTGTVMSLTSTYQF